MKREELLRRLAPCGLNCGKCVAFAGGPVQEHAQALAGLLGDNFASYAERFTPMQPEFAGYPVFRTVLDLLSRGDCTGCRGQGCLFQACEVTRCVREQGVDFCFECAEFPCDRHGMPEPLAARWQANNERMKMIGVEAFHNNIREKPRYP